MEVFIFSPMNTKVALRDGVRRIRLVNQQGSLLILSGIIGVIGGVVALAFHELLHFLNHQIIEQIQSPENPSGWIPALFGWSPLSEASLPDSSSIPLLLKPGQHRRHDQYLPQ